MYTIMQMVQRTTTAYDWHFLHG